MLMMVCFFFFQAEDGIRDLVRSRGLGDVYKRQVQGTLLLLGSVFVLLNLTIDVLYTFVDPRVRYGLSLIHI